jgi:hypothetical protein
MASRWEELVRAEAAEPGALAELAPLLAAAPDAERAARLLAAKEEQARAAWYVEAEVLWLRKLTFRLARPLLLLGVLAALGFALQRAVDPTIGVALFLFGAAALYVAVQFFAHLWLRADQRRTAEVNRRYRQRLEELLDAGASRD